MALLKLLRTFSAHPLSKSDKLAAYQRLLRWQLGARLLRSTVLVPFVNDARLALAKGMTGATGNLYYGLHEFEDMSFLLHSLGRDDLFCDVGANVGSYTVLASAAIGAECVSVEPLPATYERLLDNVYLNRVTERVRALNMGVGSEPGELRFTSGLDTINHVLADGESAAGSISVEVVTLDGLLGGRVPALMKIDVEGFETRVIDGAESTLSSTGLRAVIMELNGSGNRYGFDEDALHQRMLGFGFTPCAYAPFERRLDRLKDRHTDGNTIYVRDFDATAARLRQAPPYTVLGRSI